MMQLVDLNKIETAKMLIASHDDLKCELIRSLSTNDNCKKAAQLIKDFHFNEADFPEVKERIMKKGMRYYLSRSLSKKKNQKDFLSLDRVEDLLSGFKQMLGYLVEDLAHKTHENEALGIMLRNNVQAYVRHEVQERLEQVKYDMDKDSSLFLYDEFEPLSRPEQDYIQLPDHVRVDWIGTDADVARLAVLLKEPFIGVDSEWRPELSQYHKTRPSLFQISGANDAFLLDLVSL